MRGPISWVKALTGVASDAAVYAVGTTTGILAYLKGAIGLLQMLGRQKGAVWFADSTISASGAGKSWATAFKTITEAVAAAAAGDTILMRGSFTEAVTCSLAGIRFIGAGTGPKECQWGGAADAKCLTISANYVRVENIYFKPPAYSAGVPAAIALSGANWAFIVGCRFQGQTSSHNAIYSAVCDSDNVHIKDCEFYYMNTATSGIAILGVEAGGLNYSGWIIEGCKFHSCLKCIDVSMRAGTLKQNEFAEYGINPAGAVAQLMSMGIDLSGTNSGANVVTQNQLGGTYGATLYVVGASGDQWGGNFNVIAGGVTAANPA